MFNFDKTKLTIFANKVLVYALIAYVFFILGKSVYVNWTLKTQIDQAKSEISVINDNNQTLKNLIVYYQSDSFKELEAREQLGLKLPDEKVVAVPVKKYQNFQAESQAQVLTAGSGPSDELTNWQAWWSYFVQN